MIHFNATMKHSEKSFEKLAHMQYDLFCRGNLVARTMLGMGVVLLGIYKLSEWWGVLLIAYGSYLATGKYNAANHTAHKLTKQIKDSGMDFPASRYVFRDQSMEIIPLPESTGGEPLVYSEIHRLGEDPEYFYFFRNQYGGYMIPKQEFGDRVGEFRTFIENKAGQTFRMQMSPLLRLLHRKLSSSFGTK